ncbi:hypothetical protein B0A58_04565 [Flavobacterium branchiophilum NBRC 15030 = ATCC 35035]|uniref:Uncharacterized protein n=1 Tax=Flavobacterium branchiophilum TaxID=55197 RepID=A0A543G3G3_9FLAO|nr:hypothetical protein [Flavobacterium branchiophilum]OXA78326.1 hypothetical protein B0A58_04565 [Flavobacterium branchiophilum NBRC 15030 = ATCC 35035]TQM40633.1 hypothetical protein BC670_1534 [Flavobacterium branchiophilum]GEM56389.1 hypothetical protein FB1_26100 [Flavobacterium branchiophilum NBRC 15030 = ATCC 35035]
MKTLSKLRAVWETLILGIITYIIHKIIVAIQWPETTFLFSLETIYMYFIAIAATIALILSILNEKNNYIVGYTFLALTTIQMASSYYFIYEFDQVAKSDLKIEKINFFIIFVLFLAIETSTTARMLNKNQ